MSTFRTTAAVTCGFLLAGCSGLVPTTKTESVAVKSAEQIASAQSSAVERVVEGEKTPVSNPAFRVGGLMNKVDIHQAPALRPDRWDARPLFDPASGQVILDYSMGPPLPPTYRERTSLQSGSTQKAGSDWSETLSRKIQIPLWVGMIGFGIGIVVITAAVRYAMKVAKGSAAFAAAAKFSDETLKNWINEAREKAMKSTDAAASAEANADVAAMEAKRHDMLAHNTGLLKAAGLA